MSTDIGVLIARELLDVVEDAVPGLRGVANLLEGIYTCCKEMEESHAQCMEVNDHLQHLTQTLLELTEQGAVSEKIVYRFFNIVYNYHDFLIEYTGKGKIMRYILRGKVNDTTAMYKKEVKLLFQDLNLDDMRVRSNFHHEWRAAGAKYQAKLQEQELKVDRLLDDTEKIRSALDDVRTSNESTQRTLLYEEKYRFKKHSDTEQSMLKLVAREIKETDRRDRMSTPPDWYVPREDVMTEIRGGFLGEGSYGMVYKAKWKSETSYVAIKQLLQDGKTTQRSLLKEAYKWRKVHHHENVLKLLGICDVGKPLFFVCEYASNGNFAQYFGKAGNERMLFKLFRDAANGLNHLHGNGLVHTDLKASNILVSDDETAKISDFGYSRIRTESLSVSRLPSWNSVRWKAPELLAEKGVTGKVPPESDIFALGMCFYEVIAQEVPWKGLSEDEICNNILTHKLPSRPANVIDEMWELIEGMCKPYANHRLELPQVIKKLANLANKQLKGEIVVNRFSNDSPSDNALKHTIAIVSMKDMYSSENLPFNSFGSVGSNGSFTPSSGGHSFSSQFDRQSSISDASLKKLDLEVKLLGISNLPRARAYVRVEVEGVVHVSTVSKHITSNPSWDGKDTAETFNFKIENKYHGTIRMEVYDDRGSSDQKLATVQITPEKYLTEAKGKKLSLPLELEERWVKKQREQASISECTISLCVSWKAKGDSGVLVDEDEQSDTEDSLGDSRYLS